MLSVLLLSFRTYTLESVEGSSFPAKDGGIRITSSGDVEGTDKIHREGNVYTLMGDLESDVANGVIFY
ncbi:MAG: hypothetical protein FWF66_00530 [Candidatus Bathyarchaeota archaeon]|nr:hypothetical protein [Candidatus Termiticorpusculum sp.]MCL1969949.1 hypothetical protein [Candidatus Termiticorpusculum sp.]